MLTSVNTRRLINTLTHLNPTDFKGLPIRKQGVILVLFFSRHKKRSYGNRKANFITPPVDKEPTKKDVDAINILF